MYLCDSSTFYETYTRNTLTYNDTIKDMQTQMDRLEEMSNKTNRLVEAIHSIAPELSKEKSFDEKTSKKKYRCPCRATRGISCWPCLQRKRIRRHKIMAQTNVQISDSPIESTL